MLRLIAALSLGLCAGVMLCASAVGLTGRDLAGLTAAYLSRSWTRYRQPRPTPGQAVEAALARLAVEPLDHPLAPTLDDLADDDAADPICAAARTGQILDLAGEHRGLSLRQIVEHLELHGRSHRDALDTAAALAGLRPVALERILSRPDARRTTDAELAAAGAL